MISSAPIVSNNCTFAETYNIKGPKLKITVLLENIFGGKVTLALTPNETFKAMIDIPGIVVALILAIILGIVAWRLPTKSS